MRLSNFSNPILATDQILPQLQEILPLAPYATPLDPPHLRNPHNFRGILTGNEINPAVPYVVVFDTALHQSISDTVYLYPLPLEYSLK
jgi:acetate kinase